ncbi:MAG TPA: hypothetical protein VFO11_13815, partial [Candidatus Polarisedimenticolaceae bacterium]|nr:hypothetical protein [Candidatus Polarisedimenticolaceae bacterium]
YEVVWLRMAMAQFGVTSALTSIVLSVFMAGLALGSWGSGRLARHLRWSALRVYGVLELLIGLGAVAVPAILRTGHGVLAAQAQATSWGSAAYYLASGFWVALALLPFCALMGATFPTALEALRAGGGGERTFSYLYVANVLGALAGTLASGFVLIEVFGFAGAARLTAALNLAVGASALVLSRRSVAEHLKPAPPSRPARAPRKAEAGGLGFLFATGLMSLGMEVVWIRQFTPYLGTFVYAFAAVLAVYLAGTFLGSRLYRAWIARRVADPPGALSTAWACVGASALLPLVACDPRLPIPPTLSGGLLRLAVGILPFCATVGFLTPMLVDRWSGDDPRRAGDAYALNVLGCIAGPLLAGFALLPHVSEAWALAVLGLPLAVLGAARKRGLAVAVLAAGALVLAGTKSFETRFPERVVRRDETATVVATGSGGYKQLLVNGYGMTILTPNTKVMAHLPLAFHGAARDGLVLCFGMGTSFRSMQRWGIPTTVVELVPSVPGLVGYYHADGEALLHAPGAHVVVDDARRYLERTAAQYDVIVVDPPPPVEAAASSLLYSREFYAVVKRRLRPRGILQQWLPAADPALAVSFARTLAEAFPHVRVFGALEGEGFHFLASEAPIPVLPIPELAARLPAAAASDLVEWGPEPTPPAQFAHLLSQEVPVQRFLEAMPEVPILEDDRPYNEYFLLRRTLLSTSRTR